ncbi:MAG: AtpZ/AtpI family protein [Candidatus Omnitrophica bacterium]|nr:AtpZ/AtpI family protein [Candidatus Omnitrophota bacterium]
MRKEDFYKEVKTVGFATFIPFMLAAGPLSGYFVGDFLQKKFNLSTHVVLVSVVFGLVVGIMEAIRIIRLVARTTKR